MQVDWRSGIGERPLLQHWRVRSSLGPQLTSELDDKVRRIFNDTTLSRKGPKPLDHDERSA